MQNQYTPKILLVSGPVIVKDNKVLLDISSDDTFWKFCGGKVKDNETLQETAIRRAKEELGIDINILNKTPFLLYASKEKDGQKIEVLLSHYLSNSTDEITLGEDVKEWAWIPFENLTEYALAPNIIPALKYFKLIK